MKLRFYKKEIVYEYTQDGQTLWQRKGLHIKAQKNGVTALQIDIDGQEVGSASYECLHRTLK